MYRLSLVAGEEFVNTYINTTDSMTFISTNNLKRTDTKEQSYILPDNLIDHKSPLEIAINNRGFTTYKK